MRDLGLFVAKKRGSGVDDAWEEKSEVVTMWVEILFICHDSLAKLCLTRDNLCCLQRVYCRYRKSKRGASILLPSFGII